MNKIQYRNHFTVTNTRVEIIIYLANYEHISFIILLKISFRNHHCHYRHCRRRGCHCIASAVVGFVQSVQLFTQSTGSDITSNLEAVFSFFTSLWNSFHFSLINAQGILPIDQKILCFCLASLLCLYVSFLTLDYASSLPFGCIMFKACVQYFILTTLLWIAAEAYAIQMLMRNSTGTGRFVLPTCCLLFCRKSIRDNSGVFFFVCVFFFNFIHGIPIG